MTSPSGSSGVSAETASDSAPKEGWSLSAMWQRLKRLFGKRSKKTESQSETNPPKQLELVLHQLESGSTPTMQPENDGMVRIFCFLTGDSKGIPEFGETIYTACALTSQGRWIAGAVSRSPGEAVDRVMKMAAAKAPVMLSSPAVIERVPCDDARLSVALSEAFKRMP